jgi:peptide/nickel transport system permease protein
MFNSYIVRRILVFIPTLFVISLIAFVISINAPGDPVEAFFEGAKGGRPGSQQDNKIEAAKDTLRHELGLDLPVFYITLSTYAEPDTFYKIKKPDERENLSRLIDRYGEWKNISDYYQAVEKLKFLSAWAPVTEDSSTLLLVPTDSIRFIRDQYYHLVSSLLLTSDPIEIKSKLDFLKDQTIKSSLFEHCNSAYAVVLGTFTTMNAQPSTWKNYVPTLHFYGYNQYHRWLFGDGNTFTGAGAQNCKGVIRGDFGKSYLTRKPVTETISRALPWSVFFTLVSVILAYMISIPIGVQAAAKRGKWFDRSSSVILFMLYSMPNFLMGILLLVAFANPDTWNIFPANGVEPATGISSATGFWEAFSMRLPYFVLPIICYTYSSLAFLSRTTRVALLEISSQDFMRTAKAKGLSNNLIWYRHGLSNAMLPVITVFSNVFPLAIGGSVVLEYLFGIPGMGPEILTAVHAGDFSMIVAVFTLAGFMTLVGYLIADILYAIADPRISYSEK